MKYPTVIHHGAGQGVTGSCHELQLDKSHSLLIDCGSFQGLEAHLRERSGMDASAIDFALDTVKLLIVTHVHADHVGRIPQLLAAGFAGPILCSEPSAALLPLVLEDTLRHQVVDKAGEAGRESERRHSRLLERIAQRVIALPFDTWFSVLDTEAVSCRIRLQRAGHILGSAYVECDVSYPLEQRDHRSVFSGDLGASHTPILPAPQSPERADMLILESTYGDRQHECRASRQARLERLIDKALADHGTVLIPAFSIGRTQELLYEIEDILHRKAMSGAAQQPEVDASASPVNWPQLPIILDSPLANRMTQVYQAFEHIWDEEASMRLGAGRKPLNFHQLITVDTHARHVQTVNYLASTGRPAIVIAGHGMCAGGRIVNYLKAMLGDARHNVLFVGYQARGTPGARIQQHDGQVELDGQTYAIHAGVETLSGYSAHADQQDLLAFVTGMRYWPSEIRLVHGEPRAKRVLGEALHHQYTLKGQPLSLT